MPHSFWGIAGYIAIFFFIYFFIWFGQYFAMKERIQKFNNKVKPRRRLSELTCLTYSHWHKTADGYTTFQ